MWLCARCGITGLDVRGEATPPGEVATPPAAVRGASRLISSPVLWNCREEAIPVGGDEAIPVGAESVSRLSVPRDIALSSTVLSIMWVGCGLSADRGS